MQHHHQNSLSHFSSPPANGNVHSQHVGVAQNSPGSAASQIITPQWQQQLLKCEMIRASRSPHHRARASAMASRTVTKSAIPITNPNKPPPPANGAVKDSESSASVDGANGATVNGSTNGAGPSPKSSTANTVDHPSSTVAPIAEISRPSEVKRPENTWNSLDMGGVQIKNLPPTSGLFSFTFLANLYLNHNSLSSIPPEISKLRHLELLDLSGNNLTTVPPELGMLTQLKELYLFDNHITNLPHELGTLHQLQTLGVEGNPLDASLKSIVQKEGTPALISYLRDSCPLPPSPPEREWKQLISQAERDAIDADPNVETFRVLCYNILCERCATERLYGYTPSWALAWEYRKELILQEILNYDADFLCLQEVDNAQYEDYFVPSLEERGYEGVYWPKSRFKTMNDADRRLVDGCATFFKRDKYQLVEKHLVEFSTKAMQRPDFKKTDDMFNRVLVKDNIAVICLFENRKTGTRFIVANTHIYWDPAFRDVKLVQVALLIDEVDKVASHFAKYPPRLPSPAPKDASPDAPPPRPPPVYADGTKIPTIVTGDYNSVPESGVYEYLSNGSVPSDHPDFMSHSYGKYTSDGLKHRLGLKSAYAGTGDQTLTNYTPSFKGGIDYIWYSTANLAVNAVLGEIDKSYLDKSVGFPNVHYPSDHICIVSEFRVKPPRDTQPPRAAPVFPNSSRS
ncbi:glucose-repressible alcohol dehydrogenase transcriptional effector [Dentipellis sp. KUC8613]|nr:glucose-repressible alcohol dehydrogenase transcriptional effector [Dentipellis sp. KUC8613]